VRAGPRKLGLWLYIGAVIGAGIGAALWEAGRLRLGELGIWELGLFIGLAGVLDLMVVPLAGGGGAAASFAVYFAGLLVLGPGPIAWVAALAGLWSEGIVRRMPLVRAGFNAAHSVLSLLLAGWVYQGLGGEVGNIVLPHHLPAVVGAALCLWVTETGWVAVAVTLERGGRVWRWLCLSLGPMLTLDGALASVGLLLALLYQSRLQLVGERDWSGLALLGLITLVPSGLLYYAYRLQGHLHQAYAHSLRTLGALLEGKVEGSQPGHGERVAALAAAMAQALELSPREREQIRYAGFLHDIGKVGVPAHLLQGTRNPFLGEAPPLRLHPQIGAQILAPIHFLGPAAEMVQAHHERWDGLGYPQGTRQEKIPLGARVLSLANAYAGMTPTLSPSQALSRLRQAAGSRFDPRLVETLAQILQESGEVEDPVETAQELASYRFPPRLA